MGRADTAKVRSSAWDLLEVYRSLLPKLPGARLEYCGFWAPSESMPMDGPSRGRPVPAPLEGTFALPGRNAPLVAQEDLNAWKTRTGKPSGLTVERRRNALYGLRANPRSPVPLFGFGSSAFRLGLRASSMLFFQGLPGSEIRDSLA